MFLLLYCLLGILGQAFADAFDDVFFGVKSSAYVMSLKQLYLEVAM